MSLRRFVTFAAVLLLGATGLMADSDKGPNSDDQHGPANSCASLPGHDALQSALSFAVAAEHSGLNNQMWATIVDRDGVVCAVAFTGVNRGAQWPGSRVISAQKANTA